MRLGPGGDFTNEVGPEAFRRSAPFTCLVGAAIVIVAAAFLVVTGISRWMRDPNTTPRLKAGASAATPSLESR